MPSSHGRRRFGSVHALATTVTGHGLIRWIAASLFRDRELVSGVMIPSRQSSTTPGQRRVSFWRRRLSSALKHGTSMDILAGAALSSTVPVHILVWPEGRRQSCRHSLRCAPNHDAETGLLLENRPMHPAKLSSMVPTLDAGQRRSCFTTPQHPYK